MNRTARMVIGALASAMLVGSAHGKAPSNEEARRLARQADRAAEQAERAAQQAERAAQQAEQAARAAEDARREADAAAFVGPPAPHQAPIDGQGIAEQDLDEDFATHHSAPPDAVQVPEPPPAPNETEPDPETLGANEIYMRGFWDWSGNQWLYQPGRVIVSRPGHVFVPPVVYYNGPSCFFRRAFWAPVGAAFALGIGLAATNYRGYPSYWTTYRRLLGRGPIVYDYGLRTLAVRRSIRPWRWRRGIGSAVYPRARVRRAQLRRGAARVRRRRAAAHQGRIGARPVVAPRRRANIRRGDRYRSDNRPQRARRNRAVRRRPANNAPRMRQPSRVRRRSASPKMQRVFRSAPLRNRARQQRSNRVGRKRRRRR